MLLEASLPLILNHSQAIPFNFDLNFDLNETPPAFAFLPPSIASQLQTARYISIATAVVCSMTLSVFDEELKCILKGLYP